MYYIVYIVLYCTTGSKLEGRQARRVWRGAGVHAGREGGRAAAKEEGAVRGERKGGSCRTLRPIHSTKYLYLVQYIYYIVQ